MPIDAANSNQSREIEAEIRILVEDGVNVRDSSSVKNPRQLLTDRRVKKHAGARVASMITEGVSKINIIVTVAIAILFSATAAFHQGCPSSFLNLHDWGQGRCEVKKSLVLVEPDVIDIAKNDPRTYGVQSQPLPVPTREWHTTTLVQGSRFNTGVFQAWVLGISFFLAFARWQVGNREAAMSEVFERKQQVNKLIMETTELRPLVSGATDIDQSDLADLPIMFYGPDECTKIIRRLQIEGMINTEALPSADGAGSAIPDGTEVGFKMKMFVYIELDNLEFAFAKYQAGLLDSEQMFRACEIFESRCRNSRFRQLAAVQGLAYYTKDFKRVVSAALIIGHDENLRGRTV